MHAIGSQGSVLAPARTGASSSSGRRLGELLVDERLITTAQLEAALQLQSVSGSYVPLGQILLTSRLITRRQLTRILDRYKKRSRLGEILLKSGLITEPRLQVALAQHQRSRVRLGEVLTRLGYIDEKTLRDALCTQLHINFFDLDPIPIDGHLKATINERYATRHLVVPLFRVDRILVVAMDDPTKVGLFEDLQAHLRVQLELVTAMTASIDHAIDRLYRHPVRHDPNVFARRNVLIGPIRDAVVADLAERALSVRILPPMWQ
jgi:hypothetical protein